MDDNISLATYFRGIPGDYKCPECDQDHGSLVELKEHIWTHREEDAGGPITPEDRRQKCPHLDCVEDIFGPHTSINVHFRTHTGERGFVCPHLSKWSPGQRELCGHTAAREDHLIEHRRRMHKFNSKLKTADDPWVENRDITLSEAILKFEDRVVVVNGDDEEELNGDNAQLNEALPAQPPPAPVNVQALGNGENVLPQVQVPVNAQAQIHPPANIHLPIGPVINLPGIQHHNVPNPIPRLVPHVPHVPHHRLLNGHVVGMQQHAPHAPPPNPMPVILQEGEHIVPIVENVRYYHSVPARFRRFHPVYNAFIDVPEYQLGMIRVVRGWRRVRTQPVHPPNGV